MRNHAALLPIKAAPPGGRERLGLSGGVARSSQVVANMFVARALPFSPRHSRAAWLTKALSRGMAEYFNRLLRILFVIRVKRALVCASSGSGD